MRQCSNASSNGVARSTGNRIIELINMRLFEDDCYWARVRDGNETAFKIFTRHYTFRQWRPRTGLNGKRMAGPGETIVMISKNNDALFIWKKQKYSQDGQTGINCAVFRNESNILSSTLLDAAEQVAWRRWPGERLFTYVNSKKIKSNNPGYCFKINGWQQVGISKAKKLIILEKHDTVRTISTE